MPDFERATRRFEIAMAPPASRPLIEARHAGEDRARKQVAVVAAVVALLAVAIAAFASALAP